MARLSIAVENLPEPTHRRFKSCANPIFFRRAVSPKFATTFPLRYLRMPPQHEIAMPPRGVVPLQSRKSLHIHSISHQCFKAPTAC
jgi:hypothetical protein